MNDIQPVFSVLLSRIKEQAKKIRRSTGKQHKVVLEELAKKNGFQNYDALQKIAQAELSGVRNCGVVSDIPPPPPIYKSAICRTPSEFVAQRSRFGDRIYAVEHLNYGGGAKSDVWHFTNSKQDAVAIGLRWHELGCALEQYPVEQEGEIVYGYRVRGHLHDRVLEDVLYESWLWKDVGDLNARATPEILTRLRKKLFSELDWWSAHSFLVLDFSRPDGESGYLSDWADELSG